MSHASKRVAGIGALDAGLALSKGAPERRLELMAVAATGSFAVLAAGLAVAPGRRWVEVVGIAHHAAMAPLIAELPAPRWAKAMGQGWVAIDVAVSGARLNGWTEEQAMPLRLGGHLLAAGWIATAAHAMMLPLRWSGRLAAATLGGHTLVARPMRQPTLLKASGPLQLAWLVGVAIGMIRRGGPA